MAASAVLSLFLFIFLTSTTIAQSGPYQLSTSSTQYGPDGPWQAVQVNIGTPSEDDDGAQPVIDLYPGGTLGSYILSSTACNNYSSSSVCGKGGVLDIADSSYLDTNATTFREIPGLFYNYTAVVTDLTLAVPPGRSATAIVLNTFSISLIHEFDVTLPSGLDNPMQLGFISLGPGATLELPGSYTGPPLIDNGTGTGQQTEFGDGEIVNSTLIPGWPATEGLIQNSSYGLHIGSASLKLPLSLWIGGYDQSRLIGSVSSQRVSATNTLVIDLLDIGYDVETGQSPFTQVSQQGILATNNASIAGFLPVEIDSTLPYLYLPSSTCDAIAAELPMSYNSTWDVYLWDTTSSIYEQIVTSPAYLSFTFREAAGTNLTIKVPFALLNLTLDVPLINTPTPYFPCQPPPPSQPYALGRAFLQAAFIGVNWDQMPDGEWYLAQAPGPNTASQPSEIPFADTVTSPSTAGDWADTWQDHWTPLSASGAASGSISGGGSKQSSGARVGIAFGIVIIVVVKIVAIAAFCTYRRRQRRRKLALSASPEQQATFLSQNGSPSMEKHTSAVAQDGIFEAPPSGPTELQDGLGAPHELPGSPEDSISPKSSDYLLSELEFSPVDKGSSSSQRAKPPKPPKPVSLQLTPILPPRTDPQSREVSLMTVSDGSR